MTDGNDIRDARQRAGLTQAELAKLVGVSQRTVGNWERGETVAHNRIARIEQVLAGHWKNDDSPQVGLSSASDVELLAEIARRFARTPMEARDESQPGQSPPQPQHSSTDSSEDGSTPGRPGAPMTPDELARRRREQRQAANDARPAEELQGLASNEGDFMDEDNE